MAAAAGCASCPGTCRCAGGSRRPPRTVGTVHTSGQSVFLGCGSQATARAEDPKEERAGTKKDTLDTRRLRSRCARA
eukprot:6844003-Pyramimonas_sp.AAC.1